MSKDLRDVSKNGDVDNAQKFSSFCVVLEGPQDWYLGWVEEEWGRVDYFLCVNPRRGWVVT